MYKVICTTLAISALTASSCMADKSQTFGNWHVSSITDDISDEVSGYMTSESSNQDNHLSFFCWASKDKFYSVISADTVFALPGTGAKIDLRVDKNKPISGYGPVSRYKRISLENLKNSGALDKLIIEMKAGNKLFIKAVATVSDGYLTDKISLKGFAKAYDAFANICKQ